VPAGTEYFLGDDTSSSPSAGLNTGLTQVLSDGTNTYLYGNTRLTQKSAAGRSISWAMRWDRFAS
jgi:hypothetical protein